MWGGAYVSMARDLSNGVSNFGPAGSPTNVDIQRIGILRKMRLLVDGSATFTPGTGTINRDFMGPFNLLSQIVLTPNQQAPVVRMSGYGAYLFSLMKSLERKGFSPDTVAVSETGADASTDIFSAARTSTNGDWRYYQDVPISQLIRSLGTEIGLWPLQNPAVQMQLGYTPAGSSASSPFNIYSTTAGQSPYLVTGNATVTLASPQVDVRRQLWEVPQNAADNPPYTFVVTTLEETPQSGSPNGATTAQWKATPLSGVLLRLGAYVIDGTTPAGVAESSLTGSNALNLTFGADTQKFSETGAAAHARMQDLYGFAMPQGFFCWDFLGADLTLQDVIDTYTIPEVRLNFNFSTALGASNSAIKIIRQTLVPLEVSGN